MDSAVDRVTRVCLTRRTLTRLAGGGLGLTLAARSFAAAAQDASPAADEETGGLPEGVKLIEMPLITPFALPEKPGAVLVLWLELAPGAAIPTHPHPFSEFAEMQSGTAMFLTEEGPAAQVVRGGEAGADSTPEVGEPGTELTATAGDVAIFPSGNVSDTRAGEEGATMIILEIVTQEDEATPAG